MHYSDDDLPSSVYAYGSAFILKRNGDNSSTTIVLFGINKDTSLAINYSLTTNTWTGWQIYTVRSLAI